MTRTRAYVPLIVSGIMLLMMLAHGPILQPAHYQDFADTRQLFGLPNALDVMSNMGFALVGIMGLAGLWHTQRDSEIAGGWPGYRLFLFALILTAAGSTFYHLRPDNVRLICDRIPIALACVGLLNGVLGDTAMRENAGRIITLLIAGAISSVAWWHVTADLRPYLLIQGLPLVLIPIWQHQHRAPGADRLAFGAAILLYVAAKLSEVYDHEILAATGCISGHTLKHLLATAAAATITLRLLQRVRSKRD